MPRIFDNIDQPLLPALQQTLETATHADFCVGYFNLRGWQGLAPYVENWGGGEDNCCRLLVGMQRLPEDELREAMRIAKDRGIDNQTALRSEERSVGGQLGRPSGARFRTYERLKDYASEVEGTLLSTPALKQVIEAIYRYPLRQAATDTLNRQLRSGISNADLAALVIERWETERLCIIEQERQTQEPQIVCSLGLRTP